MEDHVFKIQQDLLSLQYQHDSYDQFYVNDPKQRHISKATVRDRLVHEIVHSAMADIFDKKFIFHSLFSRIGKGTHKGLTYLRSMIKKVSSNGTRHCYSLKMDIKRFFDSIDHNILKNLIRKNIHHEKALRIIDIIIDSFYVDKKGKGIPLGNVTSQLFANVYLHELDLFIKQVLREPYYLRYCDDFIILSSDQHHLRCLIAHIGKFLAEHLQLDLHPKKIFLRKLSTGIDFIGYVFFAHHTLLRPRTKQRMKKRLKNTLDGFLNGKTEAVAMDQQLQSYLGILSHSNQHILSQAMKNAYWVRQSS